MDDEAVGEPVLLTEQANHLRFFNKKYGGRYNRSSRLHTNRLACEASVTEKIAWSQNRHDCLFASLIDYRESYAALLDVFYAPGGISLRVDRL